MSLDNPKKVLLQSIDTVFSKLNETTIKFLSVDFRDVLKTIHWRNPSREKVQAFIYADPPYMETETNYHNRTCMFTQQDTQDLFEVLVNANIRFALMSFIIHLS